MHGPKNKMLEDCYQAHCVPDVDSTDNVAVIMLDVIEFYVHLGYSLKLWQDGVICVVKMVQTLFYVHGTPQAYCPRPI